MYIILLLAIVFVFVKLLPAFLSGLGANIEDKKASQNEGALLDMLRTCEAIALHHSMLGGGRAMIALCRFNDGTAVVLTSLDRDPMVIAGEDITSVDVAHNVESTLQSQTHLNGIAYGGFGIVAGSTTGNINSEITSSILKIRVSDVVDPIRTAIFSGSDCAQTCETWAARIIAWKEGAPVALHK